MRIGSLRLHSCGCERNSRRSLQIRPSSALVARIEWRRRTGSAKPARRSSQCALLECTFQCLVFRVGLQPTSRDAPQRPAPSGPSPRLAGRSSSWLAVRQMRSNLAASTPPRTRVGADADAVAMSATRESNRSNWSGLQRLRRRRRRRQRRRRWQHQELGPHQQHTPADPTHTHSTSSDNEIDSAPTVSETIFSLALSLHPDCLQLRLRTSTIEVKPHSANSWLFNVFGSFFASKVLHLMF